jgi:hypothetical protein
MKQSFRIKNSIIPKISLLLFIILTAGREPQQISDFEFGDLKSKSYYTTLFNQSEQTELATADEDYLRGKTELLNAEKEFKKAEGYQILSQDNGEKTNKKALKYEKKGVKSAIKAYDYFFKASDRKFKVYSDRLKRMDNNNSKIHLKAEEISIEARATYMSGNEMKQIAQSMNGKRKIEQLESAFSTHLKAIRSQEEAFKIYMNDTEADKSDYETENNTENVTDNDIENNNTYNPENDPNVYISKEEHIISKLNISSSDILILEDAKDKRTYAESIQQETDKEYLKIETIREQAENISDSEEKEQKLKMAAGLEKILVEKMIKASKLFFEADKMKYEIYAKYLPSARNSKLISEAKKYEENSVKLHANAQMMYNKANFYTEHKSNLYIQIMNAVQTELSAIQEQENAFSTYFALETTPLEEMISDTDNSDNQTGKTNDNSEETTLTFNYKGSFVYSKNNPKPVALVHKKGIIFKIQLGLFKDLLPLNKYGKYSPISYDTFKNNPYKRFMLGEYRSYKAAEFVLNSVISKGLTDPFIVAYIDGVRKSTSYAMANIQRDDEFEKVEAGEMAYLKTGITNETSENINNSNNNITENSNTDKIDFSKINDIKTIKSLAYFIQLGNFSSKKDLNNFIDINPIYEEKSNIGYKYLTGTYKTYESAKESLNEISKKGFPEAFVTAYYKGEKITLNKAKTMLESPEQNQFNTSETKIYFTVQIGAFSNELNKEELKQFDEVARIQKISSTKIDGGLYLYTVGKFNEYSEAADLKKEIKTLNIDSFVIAFKNGQRISAQEAIEYLKQNK